MPDPRYAQPTASTVTATRPKPKPAVKPTKAAVVAPVISPPSEQPKLSPAAPKLKATPVTPVRPAPTGPPVPVLQNRGFNGGVGDFAERANLAVKIFVQAHGYQPDPEMIFHIAETEDIPTSRFQALLGQPQNTTAAKATAALKGTLAPVDTILTPQQVIGQLRKVAAGDDYQAYRDFVHAHWAVIEDLQKDDRYDGVVNGIMVARAGRQALVHKGKLDRGEIVPTEALGTFWKAIDQIGTSLGHAPEGVLVAGQAVVNTVTHQQGKTTAGDLVKQAGLQTYDDFRHPLRNPGYLAMDVFGLASFGAGTGVRVAAAARAGRAGEGFAAAGRALVTKPAPKRMVISHGGYTEEALLSQNPIVAAFQQHRLTKRQAAADIRVEGGGAARSVFLPQQAQDWYDRNLSFERKVGRETDARQRVEFTADMHLVRELEHTVQTANQASAVWRLVGKKNAKLTKGQQKAIWVLATDDPNPLAANRAFHERMIEAGIGDPKAHRRHLAELDAAEQVLKNPTPAFQAVVDAARKVSDEMTRLKVENLGLSPLTADGRVAKAAQVLRGETPDGGPRVNPDSFYVPTQPKSKVKRPPSQIRGKFTASAGPYGVSPGRAMPELTHEFTGRAIAAGTNRVDTTNLIGEAYARTVRAVSVKAHHDKLWAAGAETFDGIPEQYRLAVRDTNEIPDKLRELVAKIDEGDFSKAEMAMLPKDTQSMLAELYPDPKTLTAEELDGVRWVDSRLVGELEGAPSRVAQSAADVMSAINSPVRFATLYLRPAYILNKLGNAAMLVFDQGFVKSGQNWARALNAEKLYGAEDAAAIREFVGAGRSKSYVTEKSGRYSQRVADFWARVADRDERVASFIYYADRKGYASAEQMHSLLTDEAKRTDLVEVSRRANKALVEFDNLTPLEKNLLRHFIFVYPWVSRSAVWSFRAVMEHPVKAAVLSELGRQAMENDTFLDKVPGWFKRMGYIPIGMDKDGNPTVVNATSVNTFSTIQQLMATAGAGVQGDEYTDLAGSFGPALTYGIHAATGRDEFGNRYPDAQWWGALKTVFKSLPQVRAWQRAHHTDPPLKPIDVTNRESFMAHYRSALKQTVTTPGWLNGYGQLIAGGFSPRDINMSAAEARYWKEQTPEQRHQWERMVLADALSVQGELLGRSVPKPVAQAVRYASDLTFQMAKWSKENGRTPTDAERDQMSAAFYKSHGLDEDGVKKLKATLRKWDSDVRLVASFSKPVLGTKLRGLKAQGLVSSTAVPDEKARTEYGRKYLAWTDRLRALKASDASPAEIRAFVDQSDTPHGSLPSFAAMSWANLTPDEQETALRQAAGTSWGKVSSFDKKLLGVTVSPDVSKGWAAYEQALADYHAQPGSPSLHIEQKQGLARQIDKAYPGFAKDWAFSQQPREVQFEQTAVYKALPDRTLYDQVIGDPAKKLAQAVKKNGNAAYYSGYWKQYVNDQIRPWLEQHPELKKEMDAMGKDFMAGLVSQG